MSGENNILIENNIDLEVDHNTQNKLIKKSK